MATVTGLTAARMQEIIDAAMESAHIDGDDLIIVTFDSTEINVGNVRGPIGPTGSGYEIVEFDDLPTDLVEADAGKAYYDPVTGILYTWNGTRFKVQERIICTSITRPDLGSDDAGVKIYETDTTLEYVWNGTAWVLETGPPVGTAYATICATAPVNHVLMHGQTIANADTNYPALWNSLGGTTWKSGSSLIVPDLRGRVVVGKDNMGGTTASRVTNAGSGLTGTTLGATGGSQFMQQHTHGTGLAIFGAGLIDFAAGDEGFINVTTSAGTGNSQNVQPSIILNMILKVL